MTTIPLSRVISYLRRKGVGIECLEGAPARPTSTSRQVLYAVNEADLRAAEGGADTLGLYLGSGSICPAAMGWAVVVLGHARGLMPDRPIWLDVRPDWNIAWICQSSSGGWGWAWDNHGNAVGDARIRIVFGSTPPTPAERLLAILEYEMERP